MTPKLSLHVPALKDMPYRQALLKQPETMAYNAGQPYEAPGYDPTTGCIDFPMSDWRWWRDVWLRALPERFDAFLYEEGVGFVGEVCWYYDAETESTCVGVLVEGKHRGRGVGTEGLKLITERALSVPEIDCVCVPVRADDEIAYRMCLSVGYRAQENGLMIKMRQREG